MALENVSLFESDDYVNAEGILIGLPILCHIGIDSHTLLETNRTQLDAANCVSVENPSSGSLGIIGRLVVARAL